MYCVLHTFTIFERTVQGIHLAAGVLGRTFQNHLSCKDGHPPNPSILQGDDFKPPILTRRSSVGEAAGAVAEAAGHAFVEAPGVEEHPGVLPALDPGTGQQALPGSGAVHLRPVDGALLAGLAEERLATAGGQGPPLARQVACGPAHNTTRVRRTMISTGGSNALQWWRSDRFVTTELELTTPCRQIQEACQG